MTAAEALDQILAVRDSVTEEALQLPEGTQIRRELTEIELMLTRAYARLQRIALQKECL